MVWLPIANSLPGQDVRGVHAAGGRLWKYDWRGGMLFICKKPVQAYNRVLAARELTRSGERSCRKRWYLFIGVGF